MSFLKNSVKVRIILLDLSLAFLFILENLAYIRYLSAMF